MYYQFYEWNHAFLSPARAINDAVRLYYRNPLNPLTHTDFGRQIAAAGDLFERMTRHYGKPEFGMTETVVDNQTVVVKEEIVWERPFCKLLHFKKEMPEGSPRQPNVVLVAPMSGHYATLLRGTVAALLPHNNVYITDWADARKVPLALGRFNLDDFVDYIIDIIQHFRGDAHLVAVCQPAVPVFAATALLEQRQSAFLPRSITLMGGPIDTRQNPTEVNTYAENHDLDWFRRNVIMVVPFPHAGVMRKVYPGFLQLTGFMTMNLDRHLTAHYDYFDHLVKGDGDSADKHREFYDEYLSVMDLTAEFYLQTVETVFLRHSLPKGEMRHRGHLVDPSQITRTPILTIEGENDDISGIGQTKAAHTLSPNLPAEKHLHYEQKDVGHYGVFNGTRFRNEIAPRICEFVRNWDAGPGEAAPAEIRAANAELMEAAQEALSAGESAARDIAIAADTLNGLAEDMISPPAETAADLAAPAEQTAAPAEQTAAPAEQAAAPAEQAAAPATQATSEVAAPAEDKARVADTAPAEEVAPAEDAAPAKETSPAEDVTPAEDAAPADVSAAPAPDATSGSDAAPHATPAPADPAPGANAPIARPGQTKAARSAPVTAKANTPAKAAPARPKAQAEQHQPAKPTAVEKAQPEAVTQAAPEADVPAETTQPEKPAVKSSPAGNGPGKSSNARGKSRPQGPRGRK